MTSNSITISNDFLRKIDLLFDQSLKGEVYRLFQRIFYIFQHPRQIHFIICLIPSKLLSFNRKNRILNLKYKLDALWLLNLLNTQSKLIDNFYYYLQYKIFYSLNNGQYFGFIVSLGLLNEVILKDQYCAQEFLKPDKESIILDCGAHIGLFSLWAYHLSPKSQIYSFEPTKSTFEILEKNIKENKLDKNIYPFNLALGEKIQETEIQINTENLGGGNSIIDSQMKNYIPVNYNDKQKVGMTTIDNFVKEHNLGRVDFIKMDTEGYEKPIIKSARETIKKFHPVIACSAYHLSEDKVEIPKLVLEIEPNYKYRLEKRDEEDFIFWY